MYQPSLHTKSRIMNKFKYEAIVLFCVFCTLAVFAFCVTGCNDVRDGWLAPADCDTEECDVLPGECVCIDCKCEDCPGDCNKEAAAEEPAPESVPDEVPDAEPRPVGFWGPLSPSGEMKTPGELLDAELAEKMASVTADDEKLLQLVVAQTEDLEPGELDDPAGSLLEAMQAFPPKVDTISDDDLPPTIDEEADESTEPEAEQELEGETIAKYEDGKQNIPAAAAAGPFYSRFDDQLSKLRADLSRINSRLDNVETETQQNRQDFMAKFNNLLASVNVSDKGVKVPLVKFDEPEEIPVSPSNTEVAVKVAGYEGTFMVPKGGSIVSIEDPLKAETVSYRITSPRVVKLPVRVESVYEYSPFAPPAPIRQGLFPLRQASKPVVKQVEVKTAVAGPYRLLTDGSTVSLDSGNCYTDAQGNKVCSARPVAVYNATKVVAQPKTRLRFFGGLLGRN